MNIRINKVSRAANADWDQAWLNCDYATYFQSREWAEIWQEHYKGKFRPDPRKVLFSDGTSAILPLSICGRRCRGLIKDRISSPAWTFGGWISKDELGIEHAKLLIDHMLHKCGNLFWRVNPYDPNIFAAGVSPTEEVTQALDLSIGFDAIAKDFSKGNISSIHKAQREGVIVKIASTIEDWREYFKAYEDSLARWGEKVSSRYDWGLFATMFRRQSPNIRLWLALYEGKIISGVLCFYAKKHVVSWHSATLKDYFVYKPVNLLRFEIIKDAQQNGYRWFDFNPSGGHKGVATSKENFGPQALSCPVFNIETKFSLWYRKLDDLIS